MGRTKIASYGGLSKKWPGQLNILKKEENGGHFPFLCQGSFLFITVAYHASQHVQHTGSTRVDELPKKSPDLVFCAAGIRWRNHGDRIWISFSIHEPCSSVIEHLPNEVLSVQGFHANVLKVGGQTLLQPDVIPPGLKISTTWSNCLK